MIDYREQIAKAIDYIEENLCAEELDISSIATVTGYSKYHFLRIFREVCGLTPSDYIRKRRISEIVKRMRTENRPISDIAFKFGFNSKENFSRAFKSEPFRLVVYKCDEEKPSNFWNKYNTENRSCKLSGGKVVQDFGVSDWNKISKKLDYYIGIKETDAQGELSDTVPLNITGGTYAVFDTPHATYFDFANTIHRTWDYIGKV